MFSFILLIGALVGVLSAMNTIFKKSRNAATAASPTNARATPRPVATATKIVRRRIEVAGAVHPSFGASQFLKPFWLSNHPLHDLCYLEGPLEQKSLSDSVIDTLVRLHAAGDAVGGDVMAFIHHGKQLTKEEILCFALMANPRDGSDRLIAFVDRLRAPPAVAA